MGYDFKVKTKTLVSHPWWHFFWRGIYYVDIKRLESEDGWSTKNIKIITFCCRLPNCEYKKEETVEWLE